MNRPLAWMSMAGAIASIAACGARPTPNDALESDAAHLPAAAVTVAGGAPDRPMDSIHVAAVPEDPAELAARLRDAQLPSRSTTDVSARPH